MLVSPAQRFNYCKGNDDKGRKQSKERFSKTLLGRLASSQMDPSCVQDSTVEAGLRQNEGRGETLTLIVERRSAQALL